MRFLSSRHMASPLAQCLLTCGATISCYLPFTFGALHQERASPPADKSKARTQEVWHTRESPQPSSALPLLAAWTLMDKDRWNPYDATGAALEAKMVFLEVMLVVSRQRLGTLGHAPNPPLKLANDSLLV
uniref:Uncharacterized protein n=1 Tax=Sphaerodactylus townsendi TaxID=933632 RepID=A0ACB8FJW9_9SAUR